MSGGGQRLFKSRSGTLFPVLSRLSKVALTGCKTVCMSARQGKGH